MAVFAVLYTYDDRESERLATRPAHRDFLFELADKGVVLAGGAYGPGEQPGALLILQADDAETVAKTLDEDPYCTGGFISGREIRHWTQVIGPWAPKA